LAKASALAQSSTRVRLRGILPARVSLPMRQDVDGGFIITLLIIFLIVFLIVFLLTDNFEASTMCSISQAFERSQEGERNAKTRSLPFRVAHAPQVPNMRRGVDCPQMDLLEALQ